MPRRSFFVPLLFLARIGGDFMKKTPLLRVQCNTCKKEIYIKDTEDVLKVPKDIKLGESFPFLCGCVKLPRAILLEKWDE